MQRPGGRRLRRSSIGALAIALAAGVAQATTPCTPSGIMAVEPACPNDPAVPCQIHSKIESPTGEPCDLDFAGRDLVIGSADGPAGSLRVYKNIHIRAKSLTLHPNGSINGRGDASGPQNGADLWAEIDGDVTLASKGAQTATIDVSGAAGEWGGSVYIEAGGTITIDGVLRAGKQLHAPDETSAAEVSLNALGDIVGGGQILDPSGIYADDNRYAIVALNAKGKVDFAGVVDISGYAGSAYFDGPQGVHIHDVMGAGDGIPSFGGNVDIRSGGEVLISGDLNLRAIGPTDGDQAGYGGNLSVETPGSISITGSVRAGATGVYGSGGSIDLRAQTDLLLDTGALLSVTGSNNLAYGGFVGLTAGRDMTLRGDIDTSARAQGGEVEGQAGRHLVVDGAVDSSAPAGDDEASGGSISFAAGIAGSGHLSVHGQMDANGGGCLYGSPEGYGGSVSLSGCDVDIPAPARVRACATGGGSIDITARRQMTVGGEVRAPNVGLPASDGEIRLIHATDRLPQLAMGTLFPQPILEPRAACIATAQPLGCLEPCPDCGDGVVDYPETCDTAGTPESCDGCSLFCRSEEPDCDDHRRCTVDSCHPVISCEHTRPYPCTDCQGDVDGDGDVEADDLAAVTKTINQCGGSLGVCASPFGTMRGADFDGNSVLTAADLTHMLANRLDPALPAGCVP